MTEKYFEIGRGVKLIPMEYWHQYVLGVDLTEDKNSFVISEVGKSEILYTKKVSFADLQKSEFAELIELSNTRNFINELNEFANDSSMMKEQLKLFFDKTKSNFDKINGDWISIAEYGDIDYNSNFGNWVDAFAIKGKLHFSLNLNSKEDKNCRVDIPVHYYSMGEGTFGIIYGRLQQSMTKILVWQNNVFPVQIEYRFVGEKLVLKLFEREIDFIRK